MLLDYFRRFDFVDGSADRTAASCEFFKGAPSKIAPRSRGALTKFPGIEALYFLSTRSRLQCFFV